MITEVYIKGRYDNGIGKCSVVIVDEQRVVHKVAWAVKDSWEYDGYVVEVDQYNCEILAAVYAVNWCRNNGRKVLNIYASTTSCQKWYYRCMFPDTRVMGKAYTDAKGTDLDIYADFIPKSGPNEFNLLVNDMAEKAR